MPQVKRKQDEIEQNEGQEAIPKKRKFPHIVANFFHSMWEGVRSIYYSIRYSFFNNLLRVAVLSNNINLCQWTIQHGADGNVVDRDGNTPLHFAASSRQPEVTRLLLTMQDVNVNAINEKNGYTPRCTVLHGMANQKLCAYCLPRRASM